MVRPLSNVMAVDDAPPPPGLRARVPLVGAVCSRTRLDGVVIDHARRDGSDATRAIARMVQASPFSEHVRVVLLQGITMAGFNVVDIWDLNQRLQLPVLVVARRQPRWEAIRAALDHHVPGGARKLRLIEAAGPGEICGGLFVQRAGLELARARRLLVDLTVHGALPEPLRMAHLIAGAVGRGTSRGRA